MRKAYFVDAENVGTAWTKLGMDFASEDEIFIFSNRDSQRVSKEFIENCAAVTENIIVDAKGHNDLDILIAGIIGASLEKDKKFIIISNDTGYTSFINYFSEYYNCNIQRMGVPEGLTNLGKKKRKIRSLPLSDDEKQQVISLLEKYQYSRHIKNDIYNILCKTYGRTKGLELYTIIKKCLK